MRPVFLVAIIFTLFLTSCQTLSKEECAVADWRVIGEQDGAAGYDPQDRFAKHTKACEKSGVRADQTMWYQGYQQGLPRFCTPLNGLSQGRNGGSYNNVCPGELDVGFRSGFNLGRQHYQKKSELQSMESNIWTAEESIRNYDTQIREGKINQQDADRAISDHRNNIGDWNREIGRLNSELRWIENDMENLRFSEEVKAKNSTPAATVVN